MPNSRLDNLLLVLLPSILGMAPQQSLWVRTFTRDSGLDVDSKADASLLKVLSGDFFGWFLQQNANLDIDTLNKLVSIFWSTLKKMNLSVVSGHIGPTGSPYLQTDQKVPQKSIRLRRTASLTAHSLNCQYLLPIGLILTFVF